LPARLHRPRSVQAGCALLYVDAPAYFISLARLADQAEARLSAAFDLSSSADDGD